MLTVFPIGVATIAVPEHSKARREGETVSTSPSRKVLKEGRFLRLVSRDGWEYVERTKTSGIVVIVALTEKDELLLVEQYRPPVRARVLELPAGLAGDVPGSEAESIAAAANRELLEETGYRAPRLEHLTTGPISPGLSDEIVTVFLARGVRPAGGGGGDGTEEIRLHTVPLAQADAWLKQKQDQGILIDFKVYAGLYFARQSCTRGPSSDEMTEPPRPREA